MSHNPSVTAKPVLMLLVVPVPWD